MNGRYGPYVTDETRNARMPKDRDPKSLTLDECRALLAAAPLRGGKGRSRWGAKKAAPAAAAPAAAEADAKKAPRKSRVKVKSPAEAQTEAPVKARPKTKAKTKAKKKTA